MADGKGLCAVCEGRKEKDKKVLVAKYESYQDGFKIGAQNIPMHQASLHGVASPRNVDLFEQGHNDGYVAFNRAMGLIAVELGILSKDEVTK